ncbi:hypothetical protein [Citreimonas sp.]|uniref:hypothetical protein n=1 Tax=Citreimonas sp. TaxID=3036715 RepID=UPI004059E064
MSLQLLAHYTSFDQAQFDDHAESRGQAGLTLLQRWKADDGSQWALFSVNDQGKAADWLDREGALDHGPSAHHFLRTV